ncbi:putative carboxylesterase [Rosa chinensis]|uniref:(S)-hydroxynitrile lyase n=1 Tax=Rosa chinensis TaxID=74649 RepID=A0A2P6RN14_ROSCH|nr:methylesterase 10 [Rosa chinensis]PRQ47829.1 putative carboxylesterase [Rosa chinensis]
MDENQKHFVLVHGTCHGAWCWYKSIALLRGAGHRVTALDLGASGINSKQVNEIASIWDYAKPLMEFMASIPHDEKVILVGHSYGGLPISLAMERFSQKILIAVFVTAYLPHYSSPPGTLIQEYLKRTSAESLLDNQFTFDNNTENPAITSVMFGPKYMAAKLYQNCKSEDLELAKLLLRPSGMFIEELSKKCRLTEAKFGSVKRVYVVCEEDEVMEEDFQRWMIKSNGPTDGVKLIRGAGHMVMLSKPQELCQCLCEVAE